MPIHNQQNQQNQQNQNSPELQSSLAGVAASVAEKADAQVDRLARGTHEAVDRVAESTSAAVRQLGEKGDAWLATGDRWRATSRATVCRHPVATVGAALAVGVLLGCMMSRQ